MNDKTDNKLTRHDIIRVGQTLIACLLIVVITVVMVFGPFRLGSGGVDTLPVHIIYQGTITERAEVSSDKTIEGTILMVKFYNLSLEKNYYISMSQVGRIKDFNNTEEMIIVMAVGEKYFCYLGSEFEDLIWIWIGDLTL